MDFRARLETLSGLLGPWSELWSRSILQNWPESGAAYPDSWLSYAESLDETGERELDHGELPGELEAGVRGFESDDALYESSDTFSGLGELDSLATESS